MSCHSSTRYKWIVVKVHNLDCFWTDNSVYKKQTPPPIRWWCAEYSKNYMFLYDICALLDTIFNLWHHLSLLDSLCSICHHGGGCHVGVHKSVLLSWPSHECRFWREKLGRINSGVTKLLPKNVKKKKKRAREKSLSERWLGDELTIIYC